MGTIHKRHICQKCKVKRVEYKLYSFGKNLMNGKPLWYCRDIKICDFMASVPGAEDTLR